MKYAFLARQPVFDHELNVFGYEILSRSGPEDLCRIVDGDKATSQAMDASLHTFGFEAVTSGRMGFINTTYNMLVDDLVSILPRERTVLELVEDLKVDAGSLAACEHFSKDGYIICVDKFRDRPGMEQILPHAGIVKIDWQDGAKKKLIKLARKYSGSPELQIMATWIESMKEYEQAKKAGCTLFQGYFFAKPETMRRKDVPPNKVAYLRFLREVHKLNMNLDDLAELIKQEVALSVRLLRFINSAMFGIKRTVESIKQALTYLGERNIRRWATVLSLIEMADDKPHELIVTALIRGRFAEMIAERSRMKDRAPDLFLTGMLSCIDAILDQPKDELLEEFPVSPDIGLAILRRDGALYPILKLVLDYEKGGWPDPEILRKIDLDKEKVPELYTKAISWTDDIFKAVGD